MCRIRISQLQRGATPPWGRGLDALNGTPILDIKPYIPNFDSYPKASLPEWVGRHLREHQHMEGDS
ncbi:MAG: SAM-dependent methyltransferase [ANME-2 cluster archaeon]|nr:SAM-dependent methyltransferase [ANME-2 cluster archaeon]